MTTPTPNGPEPTDRALSPEEAALHAVLDGEATADQRDLVSARPDLVDDLDALRSLRARLAAAPVVPDPAVADAQVARALAAMESDPTPPAEADMAARRTARRHRRHDTGAGRRSATGWLVAAAVLAVAALAGLAASELVGGRSDDTASVATDAAGGDDASSEGDAAAESAAPTTTGPAAASRAEGAAPPTVLELGEVAGLDALTTAARDAVEALDARTFSTDGRGDLAVPEAAAPPTTWACEAELDPTAGLVVLVARGVLDGRDVVAFVTTEGDDQRRIRVLTTDDCALVFVGPL